MVDQCFAANSPISTSPNETNAGQIMASVETAQIYTDSSHNSTKSPEEISFNHTINCIYGHLKCV